MEFRTLNNGVEIPVLGLGTFQIKDHRECTRAVLDALEMGYRLVDTASIYGNEEAVGQGITQGLIPRRDIFLTSKVWNSDQGYDSTLRAFETSLKRLATDYLDLYLVHWPGGVDIKTWKALERLYEEKAVRAIGVSNFKIHHLEKLLVKAQVLPTINQTELHPRYSQPELDSYCRSHGIALQGWGPLMQGRIFDLQELKTISFQKGRSISQIALRWAYQKNFLSIPKSTQKKRLEENLKIFDWSLNAGEMELLNSLEANEKVGMDPDNVKF